MTVDLLFILHNLALFIAPKHFSPSGDFLWTRFLLDFQQKSNLWVKGSLSSFSNNNRQHSYRLPFLVLKIPICFEHSKFQHFDHQYYVFYPCLKWPKHLDKNLLREQQFKELCSFTWNSKIFQSKQKLEIWNTFIFVCYIHYNYFKFLLKVVQKQLARISWFCVY